MSMLRFSAVSGLPVATRERRLHVSEDQWFPSALQFAGL